MRFKYPHEHETQIVKLNMTHRGSVELELVRSEERGNVL